MSHAFDWIGGPDAAPLRPVYAVYGADGYLVRESIAKVADLAFGGPDAETSIVRFPGPQTSLADVRDELFTLPFLSRRRMVIVEEADPFITKHRRELESYVTSPSASGVLVLQAKQWPATTNLAKLVERHGLAIDCAPPRDRDAARTAAWLVRHARTRCDANLDKAAAGLLLELVGPDMGALASEVEKLAVYAGESKRIERGHVAKLVGTGRAETVWKALDAATLGAGREALVLLDNLIAAGEAPIGLLAAMSASMLKLHHAGRLRAARLPLDAACRAAGVPPFAIEKTGKQHAHLGPSRVDRLPATLLRADLDLKGGSLLAPRTVLELLLLGLSRPRRD